MKMKHIFMMVAAVVAVVAGCSQEEPVMAPADGNGALTHLNKNGNETLGTPTIAIADGTGFAEGGVGMVGVDVNTLNIDVPMDVAIMQVLVYWAGATTGAPGDDNISLDGNPIGGELIADPRVFFTGPLGATYTFSTYRADITAMELVQNGPNSFEVTDFDFDYTGGGLDENNGVSIVVIYDDGSEADLSLVDGQDLAFFRFASPLDATVPQTFTFEAEETMRTGELLVVAGSVGVNRPNEIRVTTIGGVQSFPNELASVDGPLWDGVLIAVEVPAGATSLTVEVISTESTDPLGASLNWLASGLSVPVTPHIGCRMTGGGNDTYDTGDGVNSYTWGGEAGAPLASPPQPYGEWTHHQQDGPAGDFVFHAGTASAPENTEIDWIECMDPGWCRNARPAGAKQIDFAGVGTFKNMNGAPEEIAGPVVVGESLHWFEVNIDDLGEPGGSEPGEGCDSLGFGRNGGTELAECECPDFYRIRIYAGPTDASEMIYEVYGYVDHSNMQIHPPTGRDR